MPTLVPAFDHQDEVFASAFQILNAAIADRAFPAASIAVTLAGKLVARKAFGNFVYAHEAGASLLPDCGRGGDFRIHPSTLFDLASLTKPIATTTMAMILYERGFLALDAPISGVLPEFLTDSARDPRRRDVTFRLLLAHSSGLPAYEKLFLRAHSRDDLLQAAFTTPLTADPGSRAEYSDIGFILLGLALERLAAGSENASLDQFCQHEIFGPLAMTNTTFNPSSALRPCIPPTADDHTFRRRIIQGEVQDENASILGGVAGHAGLFSTAEDVARFAHFLLSTPADKDNCHFERAEASATASRETCFSLLRPETISLFTRRESSPPGTSRTLGWDTPSAPSQSGQYFGPRSYGHLGYTGTSLWIDPDRQLSITLLTNRTWPDCSNQAIKQIRPRLHNAIIESLDRSPS